MRHYELNVLLYSGRRIAEIEQKKSPRYTHYSLAKVESAAVAKFF